MKITLLYLLVAAALSSCGAFTAPKNADGIRMDIPRDANGVKLWADFDPLNYPGTSHGPGNEPPRDDWFTRNQRMFGHF